MKTTTEVLQAIKQVLDLDIALVPFKPFIYGGAVISYSLDYAALKEALEAKFNTEISGSVKAFIETKYGEGTTDTLGMLSNIYTTIRKP